MARVMRIEYVTRRLKIAFFMLQHSLGSAIAVVAHVIIVERRNCGADGDGFTRWQVSQIRTYVRTHCCMCV